ncbi:MAG: tetratricopeptide repeat protein, partial [Nitrospinota bacterium]
MTRKPGSSSKKSRKKPRRRSSKGRSRSSSPVSGANSIEIAKRYHQSGDLQKAEEIYRSVLNRDPLNAEALHLLGVISYQGGKNGIAVDLITKALAIKPDSAMAHNNLGNAL